MLRNDLRFFLKQGKGEMETFWLEEGPDDNNSHRKRSIMENFETLKHE